MIYLSVVVYGGYGSNGNYENVAITREQRLLADFAEREQRKDCEAGLMMGVEERIEILGRLRNLGSLGNYENCGITN